MTPRLTNEQASEIAAAWHSVMTWHDPGVAMYSVTSTGKVHSETHRRNLLAYIDTCMPAAVDADEVARRRGDECSAIVCDSNVEDLQALRAWVERFDLDPHDDEGFGDESDDDESEDS